jgi:hypothetical protein
MQGDTTDSSDQTSPPAAAMRDKTQTPMTGAHWLIACTFLVAGIASTCIAIWQPMLREIFSEATTGKPVIRAAGWTGLDRELSKYSTTEALGLRFVGFDPKNPSHRIASQEVYFRGTYFMWPRRLYTAKDDYVINSATELIASRAYPEGQWFLDRGVTKVVTFVLMENGQVQVFLDVFRDQRKGAQ